MQTSSKCVSLDFICFEHEFSHVALMQLTALKFISRPKTFQFKHQPLNKKEQNNRINRTGKQYSKSFEIMPCMFPESCS